MEHAVEMLRAAFAERKANEDLTAAAERIRRNFAPEIIGESARQRLMQLLRRINSAKWERLDRYQGQRVMAPPIPIPGSWYDADYFETGRKSNWRDGYNWQDFAALFRETAEFLTTVFPEANSFLDAGCAKGFLVRTLRERGKEAYGIDHSAWAIEHAEESAKPYLSVVGAEEFEFDRHCGGPNLETTPSEIIRRIESYSGLMLAAAFAIPDLDREVKWHCKYARQNGIHVSPTFMIDGLVRADMSSGDSVDDWAARLAA